MRLEFPLLLILFSYLFPPTLWGQDPFYINYNTADGLPSTEVYFTHLDENGLIWFATDRGVCTYDGYDFQTYTTKDGLSHNTNFRIFSDSKNQLWFTGWDGSITRYAKGHFQAFYLSDLYGGGAYDACSGFVWKMWFDEEDNLYFVNGDGIEKRCLFHFNPNTLELKEVSGLDFEAYLLNDEETGRYITDIGGEALIFDPIAFYALSTVTDTVAQNWLACFEYRYVKVVSRDGSFTPLPFINNLAYNLFLDPSRNLWVCTSNGLLCYVNGNFDKPPLHFFQGVDVTCILMDREENYWMTTREKGVFWIPSFDFHSILQPSEILEEKRALSIGKLPNHLILGTVNDGLWVLDREFKLLPQGKNWSRNCETKRMYPTDTTIYLSKFGRIDERNGALSLEFEFDKKVSNNWQIVKVLENGLIIYTDRQGYWVYKDFQTPPIISNSPIFTKGLKPFNARVNCMEEVDGGLWMGGLNGLFWLPISELFSSNPIEYSSPLLAIRIEDISSIDSQRLWIATMGNGLVYKDGDHLITISREDGLSSDLVSKIYQENDTTLWVGTNQGLDKVTYQAWESGIEVQSIINFSTADGLVSNFINDLTIWRDHMILATDHGVSFFRHQEIKESKTPPLIQLEDVLVGEQSIGDSLGVRLQYNENDLLFKYLGISFKKPQNKSFYRYRLSHNGNKPAWYYTNNRSVRFLDLAPGQYHFEVAAQNKNGYWSVDTAQYHFQIVAHYTEQLWFRLLSASSLIFLIALGVYIRTRRIQQKEEQKRKLQGAELNLLRNQMNPHFIFNSLNSIQNFIFHQNVKEANYYLAKFSRLMRNSLEYSRLEYISIDQELNFIKSYLELEKLRFDDRFEVEIIIEPDIPTHSYFIPPLLLQPILENSVKHAFKNISYRGKISIEFINFPDDDLIQVIIKDNGQGLKNEPKKKEPVKHQSMGLSIIENRIKLLNSEKNAPPAKFEIFNRLNSKQEIIGIQANFFIPIQLK